ncbi:MAG: UDP-N-acetylglucosamine 1-carboxyvinyltransferase, partial [Eubacteriales bacterium]|nr:UDP-N-acetylglucosamine 1-carboxyvinyltransferase [Eubacteriales bacterium]
MHEREYVEVSKYIIHKSQPLKGAIRINGAKNSVLPIMAAALLTEGESIIEDVPPLNDVRIMSEIISLLGAQISFDENRRIMK